LDRIQAFVARKRKLLLVKYFQIIKKN
jgi:hypothetical protein